jgi:hypothetical protein
MMAGGMARPISAAVPAEIQRGRPPSAIGQMTGVKPMPGAPGKGGGMPGFGRMPTPKPGGGAFTSMPSKPMKPMPGPGLRGGPAPMPGPGLRGGPAPMPPVLRTQGPASMPMGMAKGGKVTRADGCCMKGHTKGTMK